jgi:Mor family transcriptional regulator
MDYIRAAEILPQELIEQLQEYVDGAAVYIPKKEEEKKAWGAKTNTKTVLARRNERIYTEHLAGTSIKELASEYFLAEKSIQRIVRQERSKRDVTAMEGWKDEY